MKFHPKFQRGAFTVAAFLLASTLLLYAQTAPISTVPSTGATTGPGGPLLIGGLTEKDGVRLMVNKSMVLSTSRPYKRLNLGQPDIAEVNGIGPTRILITGKKTGSTQIIVWDDQDNSQMVDVMVE